MLSLDLHILSSVTIKKSLGHMGLHQVNCSIRSSLCDAELIVDVLYIQHNAITSDHSVCNLYTCTCI